MKTLYPFKRFNDNTLKMYYGAADTCIAVAEANLSDLLNLCSNRM